MADLYNHQLKAWEPVPDTDVEALVKQGTHSWAQGTEIPVFNPDGEYGTISSEEFAKAVETAGFRYALPHEQQKQEDEKTYGGLAGEVIAGGSAFAEQFIPFGLGTKALTKATSYVTGQEESSVKEDFRKAQEANPLVTAAGQLGGFTSGLGLGGAAVKGVGKALQAAGKAPAVGKALQAADTFAADAARNWLVKIAGGSDTLAAKIAIKVMPRAAQEAVENAAFGASAEISEQILADNGVDASTVAASAGLSGLLGAGVSSSLSLSGMAAKEAASMASRGAKKALSILDASTLAESSGARALGLKKVAPHQTPNGVMRDVIDQVGLKPTEKLDDVAARIQAKREEFGERIGETIKSVETKTPDIKPDFATVLRRQQEEILAPLEGKDFAEGVLTSYRSKVLPTLEKLEKAADDISITRLWEVRKNLDDMIYGAKKSTDSDLAENLRKFRGILQDEIDGTIERAAAQIDPKLLTDYKEANRIFSSMKTAQNQIEKKIAASDGKSLITATDVMFGATTAGLGGLPAAMGAVAAKRLVQAKGDQVASFAFEKLAKLGVLEAAAAKVDQQISQSVGEFVTSSATKTATRGISSTFAPLSVTFARSLVTGRNEHKEKDPVKLYKQRLDELEHYSKNPTALEDKLADAVSGSASVAPQLSIGVAKEAQRAVQYLYDKAPKPPPQITVFPIMEVSRWRPSDYELGKFAARMQVANNPMSILADLKDRRLSPEGVETLRDLYPAVADKIASQLIDSIAENGNTDVPYNDRLQLSMLLGAPVDPTLQPEFIASMQASYAPADGSAPGGVPSAPGIKPPSSKLTQSVLGSYKTKTNTVSS